MGVGIEAVGELMKVRKPLEATGRKEVEIAKEGGREREKMIIQ